MINDRTREGGIGFEATVNGPSDADIDETLSNVEPEDLIRYGLIPEFVGRLPVVATLKELDTASMVQILTEPRNSLTKQYTELFRMEDAEIEFRQDALMAIAEKAKERKTGARGLRSIMEEILLDTMFDLPSNDKIARVVIDDSVVSGESEPLLIYQDETIPERIKASGS